MVLSVTVFSISGKHQRRWLNGRNAYKKEIARSGKVSVCFESPLDRLLDKDFIECL
jgi:hypothetical protein